MHNTRLQKCSPPPENISWLRPWHGLECLIGSKSQWAVERCLWYTPKSKETASARFSIKRERLRGSLASLKHGPTRLRPLKSKHSILQLSCTVFIKTRQLPTCLLVLRHQVIGSNLVWSFFVADAREVSRSNELQTSVLRRQTFCDVVQNLTYEVASTSHVLRAITIQIGNEKHDWSKKESKMAGKRIRATGWERMLLTHGLFRQRQGGG